MEHSLKVAWDAGRSSADLYSQLSGWVRQEVHKIKPH